MAVVDKYIDHQARRHVIRDRESATGTRAHTAPYLIPVGGVATLQNLVAKPGGLGLNYANLGTAAIIPAQSRQSDVLNICHHNGVCQNRLPT